MPDTVTGPFKLGHRIQIFRAFRQGVKDGHIKKGMSETEISDVLCAALMEADPGVYGAPGFDWTALLKLLLEMLPALIAIFGL